MPDDVLAQAESDALSGAASLRHQLQDMHPSFLQFKVHVDVIDTRKHKASVTSVPTKPAKTPKIVAK